MRTIIGWQKSQRPTQRWAVEEGRQLTGSGQAGKNYFLPLPLPLAGAAASAAGASTSTTGAITDTRAGLFFRSEDGQRPGREELLLALALALGGCCGVGGRSLDFHHGCDHGHQGRVVLRAARHGAHALGQLDVLEVQREALLQAAQ